MKKKFVVWFFFLSVGLCYTAHATEIEIVTEEFPPYNYTQHGQITGISTEIVQAAFKEADINYTIAVYPWARAYKMALEEKNILIYSILRTPERENLLQWVGEIAPRKSFFYKLKKRKDIIINSLEDAKKYTIGGVRGDARVSYLNNNGFDIKEIVSNDELNIRKLFAERIELMICNELSFTHLVKSMGFSIDDFEKIFLLEEFSSGDFYMAFSLSTADELVVKLKTALDKIKDNGIYDRILTKYISKQD